MDNAGSGQDDGCARDVGGKSAGSSSAGRRSGEDFRHLRRYVVGGALLWAMLITVSLAWNIYEDNSRTLGLAGHEAIANFNKDRAIRLWAASHGGVYVPLDDRTPPNPYLSHVPERDIVTASGKKLTLMNAAYVLRQTMAEYEELYGVRGHVTSLKPINPINKPDQWERLALQAFESGATEVMSLQSIRGEEHLRFMRPMVTKQGCLKCHAEQGYKVGDIRGGLSVSVPMGSYLIAHYTRAGQMIFTHGALWLTGMGGIFMAYWQGNKRIAVRGQAGEELEAKERYFRSLLYNMREDIIVIDSDYVVADVNNSTLVTIGCSRREAVGRYCYELLRDAEAPCDPHGGRCPLREVFSTDRPYQCRHVYSGRDGAKVHVDILASPITDENGNITHVVQAIRDITEQRDLETQLRQAQKMEAIGRLAGGVAHDYRNQLTVIIGYAELLLSRMRDGSENSREIREILRAANRSTTLTGHLLAFSRREVLEPEIVVPTDLIGGLAKPLKDIIGEDTRLSTSGAGELPNITVDPGQFEHMLMNLVINARDAMPDGGELKIDVVSVELDGEFARRNPGASLGKHVAISVSDTGVGMDAETRRKAFEPFFTTKGMGKGTGLGLSMVYGFVKQSGGYITIDSEPGQGTTFTVYLPGTIQPPAAAEPSGDVEPAEVADTTGTILVVEDDEPLRDMLVEILRKDGHTVLSAGNARQALPLGEHYDGRVDILITDLVMPGMNGVDLAVRLRAARPDVAVMFTSAYDDSELVQRSLVEGDAELLVKPFGVSDILDAVNCILARRSIRPEV